MASLFANDTILHSEPPRNVEVRDKWLNHSKAWTYLPDLDVIVGMAPKCGSSSWYELIASNNYQYFHPTAFDGRCTWIVREPTERFISLWKNKCNEGHRINRRTDDNYSLKGWSIDELIDFIESGEEWNCHWASQSEMEAGRATELIPLQHFGSWTNAMGFGELPNANTSSQSDITLNTRQQARVWNIYSNDYELYERGLNEYNKRISSTDGGRALRQ